MKNPLFRMLWWDRVAPLGNPVVPLVYWMLIGSSKPSRGLPLGQLVLPAGHRHGAGHEQLIPVGRAQVDHPGEIGKIPADLLDHGPVIAGLERLRADQQPDPGLAQHVSQLVAAVGRVDVDQDHPRLGRGVLQQYPLRAVRGPDAHPVARLDPRRDQAQRQRVGVRVELGIGPAPSGRHIDQRFPAAVRSRDAPQVRADGLAEQGQRRGSVTVGQRGWSGHDILRRWMAP